MFLTKSIVRSVIAKHGGLLIADVLSRRELAGLESLIFAVPKAQWQAGDTTDHSWDENLVKPARWRRIASQLSNLHCLIEVATRGVCWINRFSKGQWIGSHKDASGDLQIIVGVRVPPVNAGGQLWIGNVNQFVHLEAGDALLFDAASLAHGTTAPAYDCAQRITLNVRLWF